MPSFIGINALESIAIKYQESIVMGGFYYRPDVFERLQIDVIQGLQFKHVCRIMNRKGHTTRRKVVGKPLNSEIGYLEERPMVGHLAWNHYTDNRDNYVEEAVFSKDPDHSAEFSYPASELAVQAIFANYGEDIFECLWHGDDTIPDEKPNSYLNLYTGFITYLNNDVNRGRICMQRGNLVHVDGFTAPADPSDTAAYDAFCAFRAAWAPHLQNAKKVLVYVTDECGDALRDAYSNFKTNHAEVVEKGNGNFSFPRWPNIEICPESSLGKGMKMIATTPLNFQYGVDTLNSDTKISVREGSDVDHDDITFQVQSIQGTRVVNVNPSNFCMTDAPLTQVDNAGDYRANFLIALTNNPEMGSVTVDSAKSDPNKGFKPGTSVQLKATAQPSHHFVEWNDGVKEATRTVVKKDCPEFFMAIFAAD